MGFIYPVNPLILKILIQTKADAYRALACASARFDASSR